MARYIVATEGYSYDPRPGLGWMLYALSAAWLYALKTERILVIDWRDTVYLPESDINLFTELFEPVSEIAGVKVICQNLDILNYPKPVFISDKKNRSKLKHFIERDEDYKFPTIIIKSGFSSRIVDRFFHTNDYVPFFKELKVRKEIWDNIQDFQSKYFGSKHIVGIHVRHGNKEKGHFQITKNGGRKIDDLEKFVKELQLYLEANYKSSIYFLSTDSILVVEEFTRYFPNIIIKDQWRPEINSGSALHLGHICPDGPLRNAANVIIDMYILSLCNVGIFTRGSFMLSVAYQLSKSKPDHSVKLMYDYKKFFEIDEAHLYKIGNINTNLNKEFKNKNQKTRKLITKNIRNFKNKYKYINKKYRFYKSWVLKDLQWQVNYKARNEFKKYREIFKDYLKHSFKKSGSRKLIFGKYDKIFVITMNYSNAGFFTYLQYTLNQLDHCKKNNFYPVVYFGEFVGDGGQNAYYDKSYGENMWEYYFEPVSDHNHEQVMDMVNDPANEITSTNLTKFTTEDLKYMHKFNPKSIFTYPYGFYKYKTEYDEKWYNRQRSKANELIKKYIRVKDHIIKEVDEFYANNMEGNIVIGIHIRGTDKGSAKAAPNTMRIIEPDAYINEIEKYSKDYPNFKILVATDQQQYIEFMKEKYGERIIYYPAIRSRSNLAPFQMNDGNNYRKGKDVLIECLLLSRCQFFLKCTSAVGEAALWFNPELKNIDMNYLY